jgi:hypothetical protein
MSNRPGRPKWWVLYILVVFIFILFGLEVRASFTQIGHTVAEIGLVIILYGLMMVWLRANEAALSSEERNQHRHRAMQNNVLEPGRIDIRNTVDFEKRGNANRLSIQPHLHFAERTMTWLISLVAVIINFFHS